MVIGAPFMGLNSIGLWIIVSIGDVERKMGIHPFFFLYNMIIFRDGT
jgi:hypothetical protein